MRSCDPSLVVIDSQHFFWLFLGSLAIYQASPIHQAILTLKVSKPSSGPYKGAPYEVLKGFISLLRALSGP